ncbi:hypothetical protein SCOCK_50230 [Actinacidiphila cocklensis]|uniref:Uncharacterized protein n=1 Tax=Actinacidiphila cocklensis TaxID=887465 RepID=A0A9W4GTL8_9ACTN|nr:hypothetical protein SCOCK_50230 [Actinacidiphila cocklensis]
MFGPQRGQRMVQTGPDTLHGADRDLPSQLASYEVDRRPGLVRRPQRRAGSRHERLTGRGQGDPVRGAVEQLGPQLLLKRAHRTGHRRLHDMQTPCRRREPSFLGDGDDNLHLTQIHIHSRRRAGRPSPVEIRPGRDHRIRYAGKDIDAVERAIRHRSDGLPRRARRSSTAEAVTAEVLVPARRSVWLRRTISTCRKHLSRR